MSAPPALPMPVVSITRLLRFNAAHRVRNPALSDEEMHQLESYLKSL